MPASYQILIAEDDAAVRDLLARIVARTDPVVTIVAVSDGAQALLTYSQRGADLLITDQDMPCLDGMSLVRILRSQRVTIPIVLLSAHATMEAALAAGADRFVHKPFEVRDFQQVLRTLLPP